jgi:Xaa-Pro aminopeptidase
MHPILRPPSQTRFDLDAIQAALKNEGVDGWLFYDHHHRDPIAYRVLKIPPPRVCTRRWYYFIPAAGTPVKLVHRIEKHNLDELPGQVHEYSSWTEQRAELAAMLAARRRVAMQYSPLNDIPYIGLVDAGTVELVRSVGVEVISSADLVQLFEARWTPDQLTSHLEAGKVIHRVIRDAFAMIGEAARRGSTIGEFEVQQEMLRMMALNLIETDEPPSVSVNVHTADPHYSPSEGQSNPIGRGDFVLLDVWGKQKTPGAVYYDVTWTGFVGEAVPDRFTRIFEIVQEARDTAITLVKSAVASGAGLHGYEVDDAARAVIARHGYDRYFVHRTGHSIGEDIHGNGANMDNFETRDARRVIPGTGFSIEPGVYLEDFGVRSEVNVYVDQKDARVTGDIQRALVSILGT